MCKMRWSAVLQYLQLGKVTPLQKLYKTWDDALADDLFDRWIPLCTK